MSATLQQIFVLNPTTTIGDNDLLYLVQSPYTPGTDAGIIGSAFKALFVLSTAIIQVDHGGTGNTTFTPFSVICAGTTAAGPFQNVIGTGTLGQQLTSQGPGALPIWSSTGTGTVTSISAGTGITLTPDPIVSTGSVALTIPVAPTNGGTGQTTYTLGDTLYASATNTLSKLAGNTTAVKQYLSQTGTGAVSAAPAWATIAGGDITGAALTEVNDTNVTMTLGGSPTTALLRATSMTLGWSGQLSLTRGGTNASLTASAGGVLYSTSTALAISAVGSSGQLFQSTGTTAPGWTTATFPSTAGTSGTLLQSNGTNFVNTTATYPGTAGTTGTILRSNGTNIVNSTSTFADTYAINTILYNASANTVSGLATANSSILVTSAGGVPSLSTTIPSHTTDTITFSPTTHGLTGTTTNDNAAAGYVGEVVSSTVLLGSATSLTSGTPKNVTSISCTAGDWDISGNVTITPSGNTLTAGIGGLSTTSATLPDNALGTAISSGSGNMGTTTAALATQRFSFASTTTVFLVADAVFGSGTATACGFITARRAR